MSGMLDQLDMIVVNRIFDKYLKGKVDESFRIELLKEVKLITNAILSGNMTIEDAREYLYNVFVTLFADQFTDEEYSEMIEEILRVFKVEQRKMMVRSTRRRGAFGLGQT